MKRRVIIWLLLILTLCAPALPGHTMNDQDKHDILLSLARRKVLYDDNTPLDSVIAWSEQLSPPRPEDKDRTIYFLLQVQLVNAYTLRGDIDLAIDRAQLMYDRAKATRTPLNIAMANQAIGDAYYAIINMADKTLESYQDAINELSGTPARHPYRTRILLKMSSVLQQEGRLKEAEKVLDRLEELRRQASRYPDEFFFCIEKANFALMHEHLSEKQFDEANHWIGKADSIYRQHPEKFYRFHLNYTIASYYKALGSQDPQYLSQALDIYTGLQAEYSDGRSTYHRQVSLEMIGLYKALGRSMEACRIYQKLYPPIDTIASRNYIRQINMIKAKYRIDKTGLLNNQEYNKMIISLSAGAFVLSALFLLLTVLLKRQQAKVKLSTQKLVASRINAENATRAKSVFLSNMSHEIRTPLNALSGFSSLLTEKGLDDETRRQCNEVIQQNSELLLKLIDDVIDLSSLEFGKLQFRFAQHDAVSICQNVTDTVNRVKQTQAELTFTTVLEKMYIETDDSRLQQLLINLLINATKFTPQGSIALKLEKEADNTVLFTVTDTGCGIPKEKQPGIFQRFEKLDENAQGSGLGLSICQLIIEHIGGKIWIDPDYTGGARFCFTHPIKREHGKEEKA